MPLKDLLLVIGTDTEAGERYALSLLGSVARQ
jgi:hypothetical protein